MEKLICPEFPKRNYCLYISDKPITVEFTQKIPYAAPSNIQIQDELHKAGIKNRDCFFTYLSYREVDFYSEIVNEKALVPIVEDGKVYKGVGKIKYLPTHVNEKEYMSKDLRTDLKRLKININKVKPNLIIVAGKWSLYLLTGMISLAKTKGVASTRTELGPLLTYRGSILKLHEYFENKNIIVIPILPATAKWKFPDKIAIITWDIEKVGNIHKDLKENNNFNKYSKPDTNFEFRQNYEIIDKYLDRTYNLIKVKPILVSVDIETRYQTIDCIGLTLNKTTGICIAFSTLNNPVLWGIEDEFKLVERIKKILLHKNCLIVGQNFSYDAQYLWKYWLIKVQAYHDTMTVHHTLYNYMPKSLDFLASVYCKYYSYWKDMQSHGK